MAHIIEISDLSAPELAPYTQLTHAQLRSQRDHLYRPAGCIGPSDRL